MDTRRFAPFGLALAGLATLAAIGLYILQSKLTLPVQISLALIVIGLAAAILLDPKRALEALTGRQARYGSNMLVMAVAVIGILVVINYLVYNNPKQWDLTEDKNNSLAPETIKALQSLKEPVKAEAFFTAANASSAESAKTLLEKYKTNSNGKFTYQIIDPDQNPTAAQADKITARDAGGTVVLKQGSRMEQVTAYSSEENMTGAIVRLSNPGTRAVYFLTGHGEYPIDNSGSDNYSQVVSALESKNYTIKTLNLLATPKIPDDALAIVVAGPTQPLSQQEVDLIKAYQEKGHSLIYLAEPTPTTKFGTAKDPMVDYLKSTWGISLDDDLVIDLAQQGNEGLIASSRFAQHEITKNMTLALVLPTARSVRASQTPPQNVTLSELAYGSDQAYGETDFASLQNNQVQFNQGKDLQPPVSLAVAGENSQNKARVLVVGDSDFASSKAFTRYGNSDFMFNSVDWAAQQDNLIGLTPRTPTQRFVLPPQGFSINLVFLGTIIVIPGLVIVSGVTVWLQRRRRG